MVAAQDGVRWIAFTSEVISDRGRIADQCHAMALEGQMVGYGEPCRPGAKNDDGLRYHENRVRSQTPAATASRCEFESRALGPNI